MYLDTVCIIIKTALYSACYPYAPFYSIIYFASDRNFILRISLKSRKKKKENNLHLHITREETNPRTSKNANTVSSIERGRSVQPVAATAAKEENSIRQEDVNLANTSAMNQSTVAECNSKTWRPVSSWQKPGGEEEPRNSEIDSLTWRCPAEAYKQQSTARCTHAARNSWDCQPTRDARQRETMTLADLKGIHRSRDSQRFARGPTDFMSYKSAILRERTIAYSRAYAHTRCTGNM